jgi:hypothetical protein
VVFEVDPTGKIRADFAKAGSYWSRPRGPVQDVIREVQNVLTITVQKRKNAITIEKWEVKQPPDKRRPSEKGT